MSESSRSEYRLMKHVKYSTTYPNISPRRANTFVLYFHLLIFDLCHLEGLQILTMRILTGIPRIIFNDINNLMDTCLNVRGLTRVSSWF